MKRSDCYAPFVMPVAKTIPEKMAEGADLQKGLVGSKPLNSQPHRHSQRVTVGEPGYGDDMAHGVTYD